MYTIGRLARRTKVKADSIRFYERQGLLAPATKTNSGYRLYTDEAVRRIAFVKRAQQCGFSLAEIRDLLRTQDGEPAARLNGYTLAAQKQADIQKTIEALLAMSEALSCLLKSQSSEAAGGPVLFDDSPLLVALGSSQPQDAAERRQARAA